MCSRWQFALLPIALSPPHVSGRRGVLKSPMALHAEVVAHQITGGGEGWIDACLDLIVLEYNTTWRLHPIAILRHSDLAGVNIRRDADDVTYRPAACPIDTPIMPFCLPRSVHAPGLRIVADAVACVVIHAHLKRIAGKAKLRNAFATWQDLHLVIEHAACRLEARDPDSGEVHELERPLDEIMLPASARLPSEAPDCGPALRFLLLNRLLLPGHCFFLAPLGLLCSLGPSAYELLRAPRKILCPKADGFATLCGHDLSVRLE
mmetsp:Transcript_115590/g.288858  ORF Transcript_115590/g.288858 Transcript_115590/m.288858 type:complete len:263 (-) Transcript_115590:1448-2236(-)